MACNVKHKACWIRYRNATGLKLVGKCDERTGESEVLVIAQLGDSLDAEDLPEHLVMTLGEASQNRRWGGEDFS